MLKKKKITIANNIPVCADMKTPSFKDYSIQNYVIA